MSTSSPSPSVSTTTSTPTGTDTPQYGGIHPHAYIIALSVLGGITLLCLLALTGFWYIKRRRWNRQRLNESFWRNWHLKAYSRVDTLNKDSPPEMSQRGHYDHDDDDDHGDLKTGGGVVDMDTENKRVGSIMDWWYGKRRSVLKMVEEGFEIDSAATKNEKLKKKQKQKLGTVHKVKRFKPNGSFEIDSDVRM